MIEVEKAVVLKQYSAEIKPEEEEENKQQKQEEGEQDEENKENCFMSEELKVEHEEEIIRTMQRVCELRETLSGLKKELQMEKDLWQKEREEVERIRNSVGMVGVADAELAQPVNEVRDHVVTDITLRSSSENELPFTAPYEEKLAKYQYEDKLCKYEDDLMKAQAKKQQQVFRTLAVQAYRQKLMEVDNLCNLELERLQQNAAVLQPLMKIAQEWNLPPSEPIDGSKMRIVHNRSVSSDRRIGSCNDNREQRALSEVRMSKTVADLGSARSSRIRAEDREVHSVVKGEERESSGDQHQLHIPRNPYTFVA